VSPADPAAAGAAGGLEELRQSLGVPPLAATGLRREDLETVIGGSRGGSMRGNPVELTDAELEAILTAALAETPAR
jgi:alcohol dehydrogenase class IV